jgi:hypothetical protein
MKTKAKTRYYLHGDEIEGNPGIYYCAACDLDVSLDHFYQEYPERLCRVENDYKRYLRSLKTWRCIKKTDSTFFRPTNARNRFA